MKTKTTAMAGMILCISTVMASQAGAASPVRPEDFPKSQKYCEWRSVTNQGAKGDGVTDDTQAFRKALSARKPDPFEYMVIYVPEGTYLVSDTISWGRRTWFVGDGAGKTVIKLKDNCDGFGDPRRGKPVVWAADRKSSYGRDSRANAAFGNYILDMTVDTGKGNSGAIGILYTTHNYGYVGDVVVRSGDGSGPVGVDLSSTEFGPGMLRRVTIEGFDVGIKTTGNVSHATLVDITLRNQNKLGVLNRFPVTIHNLVSVNKVPALRNDGGIANLALVGARLTGGSPEHCAIQQVRGAALLSHVKTEGYASALKDGAKVISGASIDEKVLGPQHRVFADAPMRALALAESPPSVFEEPRSAWVRVDDAAEDDTRTIQTAIDSGARTLFFVPGGDYRVSETIRVRGNVRRLIGFGFGTTIRAPGREFVEADKPVLRFEGGGEHPISVEWINAAGGGIGAEIATPRTVYFQSTRYMGYRNTPEARKIFIDEGMGDSTFVAPAKVVIRQCNMENNPFGSGKLPRTYIRNRGADVCVLGLKTEAPAVHAVTTDGGKTEILGGFFRDHFGPADYGWSGTPPLPGLDMSRGVPYFVTRDASLTATYFQYAWAGGKARALQAIEIRGDQTREFRVPPNNLNLGLYSAINEAATPESRLHRVWPRITPAGGKWAEGRQVTVALNLPEGTDARDVAVRYTLDGSTPTLSSKRYAQPFAVDETTTVKARCFWGEQGGGVGRETYRFLVPREPDRPAATSPGLRYRYYEGSWGAVPDFSRLEAAKEGVVRNVNLRMASVPDNFAVHFLGYVDVPEDGMYTFYTASDDGSVLYIGDEMVVDNDLPHGMLTASGKILLEAGKHRLRIGFFESRGGQGLEVMWKGPGIDKQPIPNSALSRGARWSIRIEGPESGKSTERSATVRLSVETEGGSPDVGIRYTLDDTSPDRDSTLYTGPIKLSESRTIRARCFKDGRPLPGPEAVKRIFVLKSDRHPASPPLGAGSVGGAGTVADPLALPKAPRALTIDGGLDDWHGVASLPMPSEGVKASGVRCAWSDKGLYGSAVIVDDTVAGAAYDLYKADCLEVFIEKDFARAKKGGKTLQLTVGPAADGDPGDASVEIWGYDRPRQNLVKAAWAKTAKGYIVEFLVPARLLRPAKMEPGTKLSFNVVINDDGKVVAQFLSDKNKDQGFKKPSTWGAVVLARPSDPRAATPIREEDFPVPGWRNVRRLGAAGDGVTDDTGAFKKALSGRLIYVPEGTYLVSDTIGWDRRKKLIGAGPDKTMIKLKDRCEGFGDPARPKPVLWTAHIKGNYGNDSRANAAFANYILDLTVDTGTGNPGAVGVRYTTHNQGILGNVIVRSGDGSGPVGVDLSSTEFGPGMLRDVTIEGFDIGIKTRDNVSHGTLVDVTLRNQNKLGMLNRFPVTIQNLVSVNKVPAIRNDGAFANLALVGATLTGGDARHCAIEHVRGAGALRHVKTAGYKAALTDGNDVIPGNAISERFLGHTQTVFDDTPLRGLDLADSPPPVFVEPKARWKVVDDAADDDTQAIQAAIDSGARTLLFMPAGNYRVSDTLRVRGAVRRITGLGAEIRVERRHFASLDKPVLRFEGDGEHPIAVEWLGLPRRVLAAQVATPRTVYFNCCGWIIYGNTAEARKIFIDEGMGDSTFVAPAHVVVRQCDMENNPFSPGKLPRTYIRNEGADVCVLGFKTEDPAVHVVTTDGGRTEVFGGFFRDHRGPESYEWRGKPPLAGVDMSAGVPHFITKDASLTAGYFHFAWAPGKARALHAVEIRGDRTKQFRAAPNTLNVGLYSAINESATGEDAVGNP